MYSDVDKFAIHIMGDQGVALFGEFGTENDARGYFDHFLKKTVEKVHGSYTVEFVKLTMISRLEMASPDDDSIFVQNEDGNKYRMSSEHHSKPKLTLV